MVDACVEGCLEYILPQVGHIFKNCYRWHAYVIL